MSFPENSFFFWNADIFSVLNAVNPTILGFSVSVFTRFRPHIFFADNNCKWQRYKPLARKLGFEAKNVVAFVAIGESLIAPAACYSDFSHF